MSDRREQVAESPRLGYGMSVTDPGVGRSAFARETNQSRLVCAIRKLIICRTVATAPHVYARRAPSFWSSAVVKASVTCRVWAITSSRMALRSFSVKEPGAQASASSISYSKSDTISAVRDSRSLILSVLRSLLFMGVFIEVACVRNGRPYAFQSNLAVEGGYAAGTYPGPGPMILQVNVSGQGAAQFVAGHLITPEFVQS